LIYKKDIRVSNRKNLILFIYSLISKCDIYEQWLMIAYVMSVRIRELAKLWDILLEVCENHEKMWCGATWKKCSVEPRCGCESHIYMAWRVRQIGWHIRWNNDLFLKFSRSMNREEAINGWCHYSLRVMKKCNDDWHDGW
jgi:hypothetical protein